MGLARPDQANGKASHIVTPELILSIPGVLALALAYRRAAVEFDIPPIGGETLALVAIFLWVAAVWTVAGSMIATGQWPMAGLVLPSTTVVSLGGAMVAALLVPHVPLVAIVVAASIFAVLGLVILRLVNVWRFERTAPDPAVPSTIISGLVVLGQICIELGYPQGASIIFAVGLLSGALLLVLTARQLSASGAELPPASLAFHLALAGLLGVLAARLGWFVLAVELLGLVSLLCIATLWSALRKARGVIGAFVFPISALSMGFLAMSGPFVWAGIVAIVIAACLATTTFGRHLWLWSKGLL